MRSLVVGLLVFFAVAGAEARIIKKSPEMVRSAETKLLLYTSARILPNEHSLPSVEGVVFRWGRQYWPLSEFGKCFAEIKTPAEVSRTSGYWGQAVVNWQGTVYTAHCWNGWYSEVFFQERK